MTASSRQKIAVWHEGKAPALQNVAADGVVCSRVVYTRNIFLRQHVDKQLVPQLFFTQDARYKVLTEILQGECISLACRIHALQILPDARAVSVE